MCSDSQYAQREMFPTEEPSSENGLGTSPGPIGEPSHSAPDGETMVRLHQGLSTISVSTLLDLTECPGTFVASKRGALDGYTVTLSCALTSSQYGQLVEMLSNTPVQTGAGVSVGLKFAPMTPNLVQLDTAQST